MARSVSTPELLDIIHRVDGEGKKLPFDLKVATLDTSRPNKPSRWMTLSQVITCGSRVNLVKHGMITVKPADGTGRPQHVHLDLIFYINGMLHA